MSGVFVKNCFMDLNVMPQGSKAINRDVLQFLADYGYECVAFNHEVELAGKRPQIKAAPDIQSIVDTLPNPKGRNIMRILQRLTVIVDDPSVLHTLSSPNVDSYDLLAICPGSDKVLQQACSVLNVDVISMKLDERLPFRMKHTQIGQAVSRGIFFEVCYSPAIRDATARRNTLANAMELVDVARRKNILVSSRAEKAFDTRGTADVVNLCHLFGLSGDICKSCITSHCRAVLLHSAMRRKTVKGVVACEVIGSTQQARLGLEPEPMETDTKETGTVSTMDAGTKRDAEETSVSLRSGATLDIMAEDTGTRDAVIKMENSSEDTSIGSKRKRKRKSEDLSKKSKRRTQ